MTKHNEHCRMAFGRPQPQTGCPRCRELADGAAPRRGWGRSRAQEDARHAAEIRAHNCHKSRCGPVCTFGDW